MCVLHVRIHYVRRWLPQEESESHPAADGARPLGQFVPLPRLRQDPNRNDARRGKYEKGATCLVRSGNPISRSSGRTTNLSAKTTPRLICTRRSRGKRNTPRISALMACCSASCCSAPSRTVV